MLHSVGKGAHSLNIVAIARWAGLVLSRNGLYALAHAIAIGMNDGHIARFTFDAKMLFQIIDKIQMMFSDHWQQLM